MFLYRNIGTNKSMFYVLGCKLQDMYPNIVQYSWNFHKAGHGKRAPDGVGAACKRTADQVIASEGDTTNLTEFASVIHERCPGIKVTVIEGCDIEQMNTLIILEQWDELKLHFDMAKSTERCYIAD